MLTHAAAGHRLPLRVRGLRRRPSLHAGLLPSARPGGAADLPADDHGRDGRHRSRGRAHRAHEDHRGPAVRRRAAVVGAGCRPAPVQHDHRLRVHGLARAGRAWRTACSSARAGSRSPTPSRSRRSRGSSASCRLTSRPRPRPARSSGSRASTRSAGERGREYPSTRGCPDRRRRRHRRHRRWLGRALPADGVRRRRLGPGDPARRSGWRRSSTPPGRPSSDSACARAPPGPAAVCQQSRRGAGRRGVRPGVGAGSARRQSRAARRARRRDPA